MRILGLDPGIAIVGYSVIDVKEEDYTLFASGSIQTAKNKSTAGRLLEISQDIEEIIKTYKPDCAAIEKLYFFRNYTTIIPVAQARGVVIMNLEKYNVPVFEYTPLVVKQVTTGYGRASKQDVNDAVQKLVNTNNKAWPKLDDTVDSIAIAVCHARSSQENLEQYIQ